MSKKKKSKPESAEPLSKKERKALEAREAQLAAELAERAAAQHDAAKAAKKAKKLAKLQREEIRTAGQTHINDIATGDYQAPPLPDLAPETAGVVLYEDDEPSPLSKEDSDAEIKARVGRKKAARDALDSLDRSDLEAVREFNAVHGSTIGHFATSDAELDAVKAWLHGEDKAPVSTSPEAVEPAPQVADEVETEQGRVFEVGTPAEKKPTIQDLAAGVVKAFVVPSDAKPEVEVGRNGYKIKGPDGKERQYTRITTFIKLIEDKTNLERWTKRKLMEGIIADQTPGEDGSVADRLGQIRDLLHNRDVAIAKARKADRKGKLAPGELATLIEEAEKAAKSPIDAIVTELEELGGSKVAATKGTDIHALCELYDEKGIDAVGDLLTAGTITPADLADVEAYGRAIEAAGIKMLRSEVMVVNDELKRAGRLDRIGMVRFPGTARAVRCVLDIKTGSVEYGISIPLQLENYAGMQGYDPERPDEREDLKLSRTKAVVIHLPQGKAECHIYPVDLTIGRLGNRITQEARDFRNAGKKGINFSIDLATGVALQPGADS